MSKKINKNNCKKDSKKQTKKGAFPVKHWYIIVPIDHKSALAPYCCDIITSGAIYIGEPHKVPAIIPSGRERAKPKSASLTIICVGCGGLGCRGLHKRMFWGFKSLCTIAFLFRASNAFAEK